MTIENLLNSIQSALWLSNLGHAAPQLGIIPVNADQWQRLIRFGTQVEFNLPGQLIDLSDLPEFDWFPIHLDDVETNLKEIARKQGIEEGCKTARMTAFKTGQVIFRHLPKPPLLTVDSHNLYNPARSTILQVCRIAASEIILNAEDIGCRLFQLCCQGHYPFGLTDNGIIMVL